MGYPFNTWGEVVALGAQNVIILYLIYKHSKASALRPAISVAVLVGTIGTVASGV
jgi:hypothetical protein